LQKPVQLERLH